jgi:nitrate/nitrite-specific signal transduction histidine kinase
MPREAIVNAMKHPRCEEVGFISMESQGNMENTSGVNEGHGAADFSANRHIE